jgi:hypothetical protein
MGFETRADLTEGQVLHEATKNLRFLVGMWIATVRNKEEQNCKQFENIEEKERI